MSVTDQKNLQQVSNTASELLREVADFEKLLRGAVGDATVFLGSTAVTRESTTTHSQGSL